MPTTTFKPYEELEKLQREIVLTLYTTDFTLTSINDGKTFTAQIENHKYEQIVFGDIKKESIVALQDKGWLTAVTSPSRPDLTYHHLTKQAFKDLKRVFPNL